MPGDHDSHVEELLARHEDELGRFIAQMVHSRQLADDLLQETFLEAWKSRATLDRVDDPRAWLYGIARHRVLMYLRGWRRSLAGIERLVQHRQVTPPSPSEADAYAVRDMLRRVLAPDERAAIVLFHLHGFRADEIAAMTGRSHAAVRKQLQRARQKVAAATREADNQ